MLQRACLEDEIRRLRADAVVLLPVGPPQDILLRYIKCHCCIFRGLDTLGDLCEMDHLCSHDCVL